MESGAARLGIVMIGRNEGARFVACLESLPPGVPAVYVDSGSSDGSVAQAEQRGVRVVNLSLAQGFTAARARNAGWRDLLGAYPGLDYIQFIDGDCTFAPGWIEQGMVALDAEPGLFAVFGYLHERFPEASLYNALCEEEWNGPVGLTEACGGIAMIRVAPLRAIDGYTEDLIAGEEPDMCLRASRQGWTVRRIAPDMARHDAAITRAGQWWRRMRRSGVAYADHCARHGAGALPSHRSGYRRALLWGAVLPVAILLLLGAAWVLGTPVLVLPALGLALLFPLQFVRLAMRARRQGLPPQLARFQAFWLVVGKFAQVGGIARYWINRLRRRRNRIIEYKAAG